MSTAGQCERIITLVYMKYAQICQHTQSDEALEHIFIEVCVPSLCVVFIL